MESSPETAPPPENTSMSSQPPSPPPLQENRSLTTAAPPEPAPPDHAAPTPSPPPGQVNEESPEAEEPLAPAPVPVDGTPCGAGPPPSLSPQEMVTSASPALGAAASEEPTTHSPPPPVEVVEVSPEAAAAAASRPPSPQIAEASPEDAPPPSPSPSPPASTSGALPDASSTDSVAMAFKEAAWALPALESMDADPHIAPAPPTPPLKSVPEELLPQQHPRAPSPTMHPGCVNSEPAQLPPPLPPADTTYAVPDAAGAVAVTSEEVAVSPLHALEATDGEADTAPAAAPPAFESDTEGSFQEPVLRPPLPPMKAEPSSPEMAPPGFEDFKSSWMPLPAPTLPAKTTHSLLDAAATKDVAVLEEAVGPLPILEATDAKTETAPGLPPPSSESGAEGALQQPLLRPPSPITQTEPCSPDMPPPGFENFVSSWLPPPTPLAEIKYASSDVVVTRAVGVTLEKTVLPVQALEAMDVETDTTSSSLPPLESKVEGLLEMPLLRPPTPMAQSAPCSPEMAPPGFENFKSSWPPLSTPLFRAAYVLPDAAATEPLVVKLEEAAEPPPALKAMDVDMDARHLLLLPLESGMEGSLREPQPRPPSSTMQDAPCSPDMAPPGFENFKSSQGLLPSPPLAQTAYTLHDPATTEAAHVSEEPAQPLPASEAMDVNMDTAPSLQPSSESGAEGSLQQHLPRLPSPKDKGTACSPEMVPSGHENLESLQQLPLPALLPQIQAPDALADVVATEAGIVEEVHHSPPVLGTTEEGTVPILPPPLESGSEGSLPQLEPQAHSLKAQAVDTPQDAPATNSVVVKSEETAQPPPALEATDTNMDGAITSLPLSENGAEGSLPQVQHQPSFPTAQAAPCSLEFLELLPPPPPPFLNKEMGQMVCGSCRDLLVYPRGAVHVQCAGCRTINLVLEAHEVGNVHCGRCETLLMYPFGAPAVKCSLCLFVTEIGERNVRPRISIEQVVTPQPPEATNQG